jgi:hypothetical protein
MEGHNEIFGGKMAAREAIHSRPFIAEVTNFHTT